MGRGGAEQWLRTRIPAARAVLARNLLLARNRPLARNLLGWHERPAPTWDARTFTGPAGSRRYLLYVPRQTRPAHGPPLVVVLHGCHQDPADAAAGTRFNQLAERLGFVVVYPEQPPSAHRRACWSWYDPEHQRRGSGEPEILAGLTREVAGMVGADRRRLYVVGLSAGAAMAAIVAGEYPELFAAVGVHSGLPPGAAHNGIAGVAAMRGWVHAKPLPQIGRGPEGAAVARTSRLSSVGLPGAAGARLTRVPASRLARLTSSRSRRPPRRRGRRSRAAQATTSRAGPPRFVGALAAPATGTPGSVLPPMIVLHGTADRTVVPANGARLVQRWLAQRQRLAPDHPLAMLGGWTSTTSAVSGGGLPYDVRRWYDASGRRLLEHWTIEDLGHAWSGGSPRGSFTDPRGPDATRAMLGFFAAQRLHPPFGG